MKNKSAKIQSINKLKSMSTKENNSWLDMKPSQPRAGIQQTCFITSATSTLLDSTTCHQPATTNICFISRAQAPHNGEVLSNNTVWKVWLQKNVVSIFFLAIFIKNWWIPLEAKWFQHMPQHRVYLRPGAFVACHTPSLFFSLFVCVSWLSLCHKRKKKCILPCPIWTLLEKHPW